MNQEFLEIVLLTFTESLNIKFLACKYTIVKYKFAKLLYRNNISKSFRFSLIFFQVFCLISMVNDKLYSPTYYSILFL